MKEDYKFVSVKIPVSLVKTIDEQAIVSMRSRTGQIVYMLNQLIESQKNCVTIQPSPSGSE